MKISNHRNEEPALPLEAGDTIVSAGKVYYIYKRKDGLKQVVNLTEGKDAYLPAIRRQGYELVESRLVVGSFSELRDAALRAIRPGAYSGSPDFLNDILRALLGGE